jgi:hypothetical protein
LLGGAEVGVRSTSREFGQWLDGALRTYRSRAQYYPIYSIVIAEASAQGGRAKERYHILYKGTIATIKTPDIQTLIQTFLSDLEMFLLPDRTDAIFADMNVVSLDGVNALVPGSVVPFIGTLGRRRLARAGLTLPAERAVAIQPLSGRVVPVKPLVELTEGALDSLPEVILGNGSDPRMVVQQPTAVDVLVSIGWGRQPLVEVSKGLGLYRLGSHVMNLEELGGAALEGVRPLVEQARSYEMASAKPHEMLDALLKVFQTA